MPALSSMLLKSDASLYKFGAAKFQLLYNGSLYDFEGMGGLAIWNCFRHLKFWFHFWLFYSWVVTCICLWLLTGSQY